MQIVRSADIKREKNDIVLLVINTDDPANVLLCLRPREDSRIIDNIDNIDQILSVYTIRYLQFWEVNGYNVSFTSVENDTVTAHTNISNHIIDSTSADEMPPERISDIESWLRSVSADDIYIVEEEL